MTRAKKQLCVVGDSWTIGNGKGYLANWVEWLHQNAEVHSAAEV